MLIKFRCGSCSQEFKVALDNLGKKNELLCQNCGKEFPKNALNELQSAVFSIEETNKMLQEKSDDKDLLIVSPTPRQSWYFSFQPAGD